MTRRAVLCLAALASLAPLAWPGLAHANAYRDVLAAYQRHGAVPACQFSSRTLSAAIKEEDTYDAQYFADFTNSIETAIESRAGGQCSAGGSSGSLAAGGTSGPSLPAGGQRLGPLTAATGSGIPAPIILMGLIALVAGLAGLGAGLARSGGWDPAWAAAWRHGLGEAGYRLSAILADFTDWRKSSRRRSSA